MIMKKTHLVLAASLLSLAACGDTVEEAPVEAPAEAPGTETPEPAPVAANSGPVDMIKIAGRWKTPVGLVEKDKWIVIDLTAEGDFSMDVRSNEGGKEAIHESVMGKASAEGSVVKGSFQEGPGVHMNLKKYTTWTLDPNGSLADAEGKSVKIAKE